MKAKALIAGLAALLFASAPVLAQDSKKDDKNVPAAHPTETPKTDKDGKDHKKHDDKKNEKKELHKATVGAAAPDFKAKDSDGKDVSLSELTAQGKVVVLQWFNPDCPYVKKHYDGDTKTFNELNAKYKDKGVVLLAVSSNAPGTQGSGTERVNKARKDWHMEYPVVMDQAGDIGKAYDAKNTPAMVVIGKDGKVAYMGAIDDDSSAENHPKTNYVAKALDELVAGKPVTTSKTKPYGCGVKYKD